MCIWLNVFNYKYVCLTITVAKIEKIHIALLIMNEMDSVYIWRYEYIGRQEEYASKKTQKDKQQKQQTK